MNQLFGKSELEKLRDLNYKTDSHTFSKGVIASYYNGLEYPMFVSKDCIKIKRRKEKVFFCLTKDIPIFDKKKDIVYELERTDFAKKKIKEVIYDLEKIFTNPQKQIRRGITLTNRKEIVLRDSTQSEIDKLYHEWSEYKMNDPKVYRIAFTPKRYLRSFELKEKGFKIADFYYYVNRELYGALAYEAEEENDTAFELAFISRYWRKDLKLTNDLNELILVNSFYQLYRRGVKKINVGTHANIKGLRVFKKKLPNEELIIYSN
jgi:hypothetical protein